MRGYVPLFFSTDPPGEDELSTTRPEFFFEDGRVIEREHTGPLYRTADGLYRRSPSDAAAQDNVHSNGVQEIAEQLAAAWVERKRLRRCLPMIERLRASFRSNAYRKAIKSTAALRDAVNGGGWDGVAFHAPNDLHDAAYDAEVYNALQ